MLEPRWYEYGWCHSCLYVQYEVCHPSQSRREVPAEGTLQVLWVPAHIHHNGNLACLPEFILTLICAHNFKKKKWLYKRIIMWIDFWEKNAIFCRLYNLFQWVILKTTNLQAFAQQNKAVSAIQKWYLNGICSLVTPV